MQIVLTTGVQHVRHASLQLESFFEKSQRGAEAQVCEGLPQRSVGLIEIGRRNVIHEHEAGHALESPSKQGRTLDARIGLEARLPRELSVVIGARLHEGGGGDDTQVSLESSLC